jgi:hypothetical protein
MSSAPIDDLDEMPEVTEQIASAESSAPHFSDLHAVEEPTWRGTFPLVCRDGEWFI